MFNGFKDRLGDELQVGDKVFYISAYRSSVDVDPAIVEGFSPKKVRITPMKWGCLNTSNVNEHRLLKVTDEQFDKYVSLADHRQETYARYLSKQQEQQENDND